jgi:hypothetical protein
MPAKREIGKQQITRWTIEIPPSFYIGNSDQKPVKDSSKEKRFCYSAGFSPGVISRGVISVTR